MTGMDDPAAAAAAALATGTSPTEQQIAVYINQKVEAEIALRMAALTATMAPTMDPTAPSTSAAPIIKPSTPGPFHGYRGEDISLWIWQVGKWLAAGRVEHDIEKITLAAGLLRDAALAWWRGREQQAGAPITWEAFALELKHTFEPVNPEEVYRSMIDSVKQTTDVDAYTNLFRSIIVHLPTMEDSEKKYRYMAGLKRRTQEAVRMRAPKTFEEAVEIAMRFDMVYRPPTMMHGGMGMAASGPAPMELGSISFASRNSRQRPNGHPNGQRPRPNQRQRQGPKLRDAERQKLMADNKCFHCKKVGHMWKHCPHRQ